MFQIIFLLAFCVVVSYGIITPEPPVFCGETPKNMMQCLKNPQVLSPGVISSCRNDQSTECQIMTCAFRKYKFLYDTKVDKIKVIKHLKKLSKDKPEWKTVLDHAILHCVERDLPPQGIYLTCPAYDILHCVLISFIKQTEASQWDSSPGCVYPRHYAEACPVCPSECFAPKVPRDSCNACYASPPA